MIEVNVNPKGEGHDVMVAVNGNFKELLTEAFLAIGTICARAHNQVARMCRATRGRRDATPCSTACLRTTTRRRWRYLRRPARKGRCG